MMKSKYYPVTDKELDSVKNKEGISLRRLTHYTYLYTFSSNYEVREVYVGCAKLLKRRSYDKRSWVYCFVIPGTSYNIKNLYTEYRKVVSRIRNQIQLQKKQNSSFIKRFERNNRSLDFALFKLRS